MIALSEAERDQLGTPLEIGATATVALGLYHRWEPSQIYMMLVTGYGDASGTDAAWPIMTLGGYVSTLGKWNHFDLKWDKQVRRAGLPGYYHATEHWNTAAGAAFGPYAAQLLANYAKFGFVIELDKDSYERDYISGNRTRKPQLDTKYSLCFRVLLALVLPRVSDLFRSSDEIKVNFILESGDDGSGDSLKVIREIQKTPETQDFAAMLGAVPVAFGEKKKVPGLQAADMLAFGGLKAASAALEMHEAPDGVSAEELTAMSEIKPPLFHVRIDKDVLASLKGDIITMIKIRKLIADEAIATRKKMGGEE